MHLHGNAVGLDHNRFAIEYARSRGLEAVTPEEFESSEYNARETFDSILLSYVAEHMRFEELVALLRRYRPLLKAAGRAYPHLPAGAGVRVG
jgi:predicted SAM-dependent methyltransferase